MGGNCGGLHCDGCGHGGGPAGLAACVALILLIIVGVGRAVWRGVSHGAVAAAEVVAVVAVSGAGLVAVGGLAVLGVRVRRRMLARQSPMPYTVTARPGRQVPDGPRPGLAGPGRVLLGVDSAGRPVYADLGCGDPVAPIGTDAHLAISTEAYRGKRPAGAVTGHPAPGPRRRRGGRWS